MNNLILSGLTLSVLLVFTYGTPLCTPPQWEGHAHSIGAYYYHGHPGMIKDSSFISYDAVKKRIATYTNYVNEDIEDKFKMLVIYGPEADDAGKAYILDIKKDKCWVKKIEKPFKECCIPADAKHMADYNMGLEGKGGFPVSSYLVQKGGSRAYISVNKLGDKIIPITEYSYGYFRGSHFLDGVGYGDITPGIKNASVFDIPKECDEELDNKIYDLLNRRQSLLTF